MKYVFQVFNGDLSEKSLADPKQIVDQLAPFHFKGSLAGVLCGWSLDKAFYRELGETLKEWNVPMYFKTAVFSEWNLVEGFDPMIDFDGKEMEPYHLNDEENFLFRCPSSVKNRQKILSLYQEEMSELGFAGMFLDRIRYSSLIGGIPGVGGCFCDTCCERYRQEGLDVNRLKRKLRKASEEGKMPLVDYREGRWSLEDKELDRFFQVRCRIMEEAVTYFADAVHAQGGKIGLDLFAPAFGYFAGQDVLSLSEKVDFIKPMLYRYTDAPAGIPFEAGAFHKALGDEAYDCLLSQAGSMENLAEEYVERELQILKKSSCEVYAGMEVNTVEPIVYMTPDRVREELRILRASGVETMIPAWNLSKMSKECLDVLLNE